MLLLQPNSLLRGIYPRALWHADRQKKEIFLTFDDGPIPGLTEWVLDQLRDYGAKATFFCVGDNILKHPDIHQRILREGHISCNHTMFHSRGFKKTVEEYLNEVEACNRLTGNEFFRPPYGQLKRSQYNALLKKGYTIVLWDVISYDYEKISPRQCLQNVLRSTREGSIVLFHDNLKAEKNLRHALPEFLKHFSEKGFFFNHLGSLRANAGT